MSEAPVSAVLLAAGESRRLGQPKQLVQIAGESLLHRTARLAGEAGCSPVVVVVGYQAARMGRELHDLDVLVCENPGWPEGMGSSLRAGMGALLQQSPSPPATLLLVCDQPRLSREHLALLLQQHGAGGFLITASIYRDHPGVPAVFASSLHEDLAGTQGDAGARALIRRHGQSLQPIPWPEGAFDLDEPADLDQLSCCDADHRSARVEGASAS